VFIAPGERGGRSRDRPAVDLIEASEEPPVSEMGEADEVVCAAVNLLHECGFRVHAAARSENAPYLLGAEKRISDVLEHALCDHRIERFVGKWDGMRIADDGCEWSQSGVGLHQLHVRRVENLDAEPADAAADDEHAPRSTE
jgi:hypothetical protein